MTEVKRGKVRHCACHCRCQHRLGVAVTPTIASVAVVAYHCRPPLRYRSTFHRRRLCANNRCHRHRHAIAPAIVVTFVNFASLPRQSQRNHTFHGHCHWRRGDCHPANHHHHCCCCPGHAYHCHSSSHHRSIFHCHRHRHRHRVDSVARCVAVAPSIAVTVT